jgi:hypothetical protein
MPHGVPFALPAPALAPGQPCLLAYPSLSEPVLVQAVHAGTHFDIPGYGTAGADTPALPYYERLDELPWRSQLVAGSVLDAKTKEGCWYTSTVLAVHHHMLKIAFRCYHDQGDKKDSQGNRFSGLE